VIGIADGGTTANASRPNAGVYGLGRVNNADGVRGVSETEYRAGVRGHGQGINGIGVVGVAENGPSARAVAGYNSGPGDAGYFAGNVFISSDLEVDGKITKAGSAFKIDHPLDPANRYLQHAAVESPDMMNVYAGKITTDTEGNGVVELPTYCQELNDSFCYQLTVIGGFAQAVVSEEIRDNRFSIATDRPEVTVSWQVTGVRKDPWAERNRLVVEEEKPDEERGKFLHPELYGEPVSRSINYETMRIDYESIVETAEQEDLPTDGADSP
jgi:hypothetical protein